MPRVGKTMDRKAARRHIAELNNPCKEIDAGVCTMFREKDIPIFTRWGSYAVDVEWRYLESWLKSTDEPGGMLVMDPDFQRAHVWTEEKQVKYVEYCMRGGMSGRDIFWNCATWHHGNPGADEHVYLVDGKQRLQAVRRFMANEIRAFGHLLSEMEPNILRFHRASFKMHVNDLRTRTDMLTWYLELNDGGVIHTQEELDKVRELLAKEK